MASHPKGALNMALSTSLANHGAAMNKTSEYYSDFESVRAIYYSGENVDVVISALYGASQHPTTYGRQIRFGECSAFTCSTPQRTISPGQWLIVFADFTVIVQEEEPARVVEWEWTATPVGVHPHRLLAPTNRKMALSAAESFGHILYKRPVLCLSSDPEAEWTGNWRKAEA